METPEVNAPVQPDLLQLDAAQTETAVPHAAPISTHPPMASLLKRWRLLRSQQSPLSLAIMFSVLSTTLWFALGAPWFAGYDTAASLGRQGATGQALRLAEPTGTPGAVPLKSLNAPAQALAMAKAIPDAFGEAVAQGAVPPDGSGAAPVPAVDANGYLLENAQLLKRTLALIESRYLEAPTLKGPELFVAGIEGLVRFAPDCLWVPPSPDRPGALMVGRRVLLLEPASVETLDALGKAFEGIFRFYLQARELDPDPVEAEYAVIRGMLTRLDRPTMLLVGNRLDEFKIRNRGAISGIGCTVGIRSERPTILKIVEDSPSASSGLKVGDQLLRIDGESTLNMGTSDVVSRIRGPSGTWVVLDIQRGTDPSPLRLRIMRDRVKLENVEAARLESDIGYVHITNFNDETLSNFRTRVARIAPRWQGLKGLVIDLRQNTGGSLKQSAYMVDEFVSEGVIVRTEGRSAQVVKDLVREIVARPGQLIPNVPLAVLVDSKTASGAEILAGALKYLDRAVIIGQRTYGKGSVQQEYPLSQQASVKMTVARYLLPGDHFIHAIGIQPDITLVPVEVEDEQILFRYPGLLRGEGDEDYHEIEGSTEPLAAPLVQLYYHRPAGETSDDSEQRLKEDFQVKFAAGLLVNAPEPTRAGVLSKGQAYVQQVQKEREADLLDRFLSQGLDWTAGQNTQGARAVVHMRLEPAGELLKAGETGQLVLEITNEGIAPFHRLRAISESSEPLLNGRQLFFGRVMPGETRQWKVPVKTPVGVSSGVRQVVFNFLADGETPPSFSAGVAFQGGAEPSLEIELSYEDQGNSNAAHNHDRQVQPGEEVKLSLQVRNAGSGPSGELTLSLLTPLTKQLELKQAKVVLPPLEAGKTMATHLSFERRSGAVGDDTLPLQLTLQIQDKTYGHRLERVLDFGQPWTGRLKIVPPRVDFTSALPLQTLTQDQVTLSGQVRGLNGIRQLSFYRGNQKIQRLLPGLQANQAVVTFPFRVDVPLLSGANRLEVVSEDEVGLKVYKQLWVRKEPSSNP